MTIARSIRAARADALVPVLAIALGSAALAAKEHRWSSMWTLALVGAIGLVGQVPGSTARTRRGVWIVAVVIGCVAFAATRAFGVPILRPVTLAAIGANTLAAIAEEAFFRRYAYAWLARAGTAFAIVLTSVLFALVHVPQYGAAVLPLDLAAGLLFGWQRWATGGWTAPAVTHAVANFLSMG